MWAATVEHGQVGGKRQRQVLYAKTRPELLRKLLAAQDRHAQGRPILDARRSTGDFLAYWASDILPGAISDNTLQGYRHIVRSDITPYIGHIPLAQLRSEHVHVMLRTPEVERGLAPRTINYARAVLRPALRLAERWDMVTRNVAALVDPPRQRQRRRQPDHLPLADVQWILQAAPADRLGALYVLAVTCGLRRGEVLALQWSHGSARRRKPYADVTGRVRGSHPSTAGEGSVHAPTGGTSLGCSGHRGLRVSVRLPFGSPGGPQRLDRLVVRSALRLTLRAGSAAGP